MEQKQTKVAKKALWSVYVTVERNAQVGRSMVRRKRLIAQQEYGRVLGVRETILREFLYVNVIKMYKKEDILYIQVDVGKKKELHKHDVESITQLQIRKHDRSGRIE